MSAPWESPQAERQSRTRGPGNNTQIDDSIASSEDLLFDFFDFFDKTVDQMYAYVLHRTRVPAVAEEILLNVYFSLLQRRRFFWWRNVAEVSTLLPVADKAIAAMPRWEEKTIGDEYMQELKKCVPEADEEATIQKLEAVIKTVKSMPVKEQKVAVMRFFLHWTPEMTAKVLEKNVSAIEKEYEGVLHSMIQSLSDESVFQEVSVEKFLKKIACPPLDGDTKANLRVAILEKYRAAQMSNVRFVAPVAAALMVVTVGGYTAFSTFMLPPVSGKNTVRQVAAAQVLLMEEEFEIQREILETERQIRSVTAYFAEKDLARISADLLPPTLEHQTKLEQEVNTVLRRLSTKSLIISLMNLTDTAYAEEE